MNIVKIGSIEILKEKCTDRKINCIIILTQCTSRNISIEYSNEAFIVIYIDTAITREYTDQEFLESDICDFLVRGLLYQVVV